MLITNRLFNVFRASARGLEAQRIAMSTSAENIANANTSRGADGQPYAIKRAVHETQASARTFGRALDQAQGRLQTTDSRHLAGRALRGGGGADAEVGPLTDIQESQQERLEYDPTHPDADENGYVHYPDINVVEEMARMMSANRVYEANLTAVQAAKDMIKRTLEL